MDVKNRLEQGIASARSGHRDEARTDLLKVVEEDPKNLTAWLWLSDLVDDPQDRIIALENALTINPQQSQVRNRLEQIKKEVADQTRQDTTMSSAVSTQADGNPQTSGYETPAQPPVGLADQFMLDLRRLGPAPVVEPTKDQASIPIEPADPEEKPDDPSETFISSQPPASSSAPRFDPALARLGEFSPRFSDEQRSQQAKRIEVWLVQARETLLAGNRQQGIDFLHQVVWNEPDHEEGWLLLSQSSFDMEEKVEALTKAVNINPQNLEAKKQLDQWAPLLKSSIDLGKWYQKQGDLDRALLAYTRALMEAHSVNAKTEADRSILEMKKRLYEPQVKVLSPTWTIFRFSVWPVLLYLLLIFILGGLNLLTLEPVLVLGILFVIPGSIFLAISTTRPTHPAWVPLFRAIGEKHEDQVHFLVGGVAIVLLIIPYTILILNAVAQLEFFRLTNP